DEIGHVPQQLALAAQRVLQTRLEPFGRLDQGVQLVEAGALARGVAGELLVPAPRGGELAPRAPQLGPAAQLIVAGEGVEDVELVRRPGKAPLLELSRHRDEALRRRRDVLARGGAAPRVRARAPVREDAAREDD